MIRFSSFVNLPKPPFLFLYVFIPPFHLGGLLNEYKYIIHLKKPIPSSTLFLGLVTDLAEGTVSGKEVEFEPALKLSLCLRPPILVAWQSPCPVAVSS